MVVFFTPRCAVDLKMRRGQSRDAVCIINRTPLLPSSPSLLSLSPPSPPPTYKCTASSLPFSSQTLRLKKHSFCAMAWPACLPFFSLPHSLPLVLSDNLSFFVLCLCLCPPLHLLSFLDLSSPFPSLVAKAILPPAVDLSTTIALKCK